MKKLVLLSASAFLLSVTNCEAGFLIKKHAVAIESVEKTEATPVATQETPDETPMVTTGTAEHAVAHKAHKHSFLQRVVNFLMPSKEAIPQILYIILAIFPLGWLGMGLNDNFTGSDWLISLILYLLMWLPGFIYTLIKMNKYY